MKVEARVMAAFRRDGAILSPEAVTEQTNLVPAAAAVAIVSLLEQKKLVSVGSRHLTRGFA